MNRQQKFEAIWYGGRSPGLWLVSLSVFFRLLAWSRRLAYRLGILRQGRLPVPVVVVGNITVGGTGKTPMVHWLWQKLTTAGLRVGVIARGVGGDASLLPVGPETDPARAGDEPVLLARRGVGPIMVGRNRLRAARRLLSEHALDLILSDDGLQHYRLPRQFEIVLLDGLRGVGNGRLLPAGPMREPISRLHAVDEVVSNSAHVAGIMSHLMTLVAGDLEPVGEDGTATPLDQWQGREVHAVAGIGHPERFFLSLERLGLKPRRHPFEDHHAFTAEELDFGDELPVVMTEKDAVKCRAFARPNWYYLPVQASFSAAFESQLLARLQALHADSVKKVYV